MPSRRKLSPELANFFLAFLLVAVTRNDGAKRVKLQVPSKGGKFKAQLPRLLAEFIRCGFDGSARAHPFLAGLLGASGTLSADTITDLWKVPGSAHSSHPHFHAGGAVRRLLSPLSFAMSYSWFPIFCAERCT